MLHLHRLKHDKLLPFVRQIPDPDIDCDHDTGHQRGHDDRVVGTGGRRRHGPAWFANVIESRFHRPGSRRFDELG